MRPSNLHALAMEFALKWVASSLHNTQSLLFIAQLHLQMMILFMILTKLDQRTLTFK